MKDGKKKRARPDCECSDPGCNVHRGQSACSHGSTNKLIRVDMDDSPIWFCGECAADAMESGLFTSHR